MDILKSLKNSFIVRSSSNSHRYYYFVNGKLQTFETHERDFHSVLASIFGNLNGFFMMPTDNLAKAALTTGLTAALTLGGMFNGTANALPTGETSVSGNIQFSRNGNKFTVQTNAGRSIAEYQTFDIGSHEWVDFVLPGRQSAILNRVVGGSPSEILGKMTGNGQIFLVNPSGILFGAGSQINVGSLFASTLNISNQDFLSGNLNFTKGAGSSAASVINQGDITVDQGGYVVLAGSHVVNEGNIYAPGGTVSLSAGDQIAMNVDSDLSVEVEITEELSDSIENVQDAVRNSGLISANGGFAQLQAKLTQNLYEAAVNNEGRVEAQTVGFDQGAIEFYGEGADVVNTGIVDASGVNGSADAGSITIQSDANTIIDGQVLALGAEGGQGGSIDILGENIGLLALADVDASGDAGGGSIHIGGNQEGQGPLPNAKNLYVDNDATIKANANTLGDGGSIILYADEVAGIYGDIEAQGGAQGGDGGFVETSGKQYLNLTVSPNVGARHSSGLAGSWLIDPYNLDVVAGIVQQTINTGSNANFTSLFTSAGNNSRIGWNVIKTGLQTGSVRVQTGGGGIQQGDIRILTDLDFDGIGNDPDKELRFRAHDDIFLSNYDIYDSNTATADSLSVTLRANKGTTETEGRVYINNSTIETHGGDFRAANYNPDVNSPGELTSHGVEVRNSTINTSGGDLTVTGKSETGYGVSLINSSLNSGAGETLIKGVSDSNIGVGIQAVRDPMSVLSTSGGITIEGNSSGSTSFDVGVYLNAYEDGVLNIGTQSGDLTVTGSAANLNEGVFVRSGANDKLPKSQLNVTSVSGNIGITGTSDGREGVEIASEQGGILTISNTSGNIEIEGTSQTANGLVIRKYDGNLTNSGGGLTISNTSGDITLTGTNVNNLARGLNLNNSVNNAGSATGVNITNDSGNLTLVGSGRLGIDISQTIRNNGSGTGLALSTNSGDLTITGTGNGWHGVSFYNSLDGAPVGADYSVSTQSGNLSITGTSNTSSAVNASNNQRNNGGNGRDLTLSSVSGDLEITGTSGTRQGITLSNNSNSAANLGSLSINNQTGNISMTGINSTSTSGVNPGISLSQGAVSAVEAIKISTTSGNIDVVAKSDGRDPIYRNNPATGLIETATGTITITQDRTGDSSANIGLTDDWINVTGAGELVFKSNVNSLLFNELLDAAPTMGLESAQDIIQGGLGNISATTLNIEAGGDVYGLSPFDAQVSQVSFDVDGNVLDFVNIGALNITSADVGGTLEVEADGLRTSGYVVADDIDFVSNNADFVQQSNIRANQSLSVETTGTGNIRQSGGTWEMRAGSGGAANTFGLTTDQGYIGSADGSQRLAIEVWGTGTALEVNSNTGSAYIHENSNIAKVGDSSVGGTLDISADGYIHTQGNLSGHNVYLTGGSSSGSSNSGELSIDGNITATNEVGLTSVNGQDIIQESGLISGTSLALNSAGDVYGLSPFDTAVSNVTYDVTGNVVDHVNTGDLTIGNSTVGGSLEVATSGNLAVSGVVDTAGADVESTGGNVAITGSITSNGNDISVTADNEIAHTGTLDSTGSEPGDGNITLVSGGHTFIGATDKNDAATAVGSTAITAKGDVSITAGNPAGTAARATLFHLDGTIESEGGDVTLTGEDWVNLNSEVIADNGTISVTAVQEDIEYRSAGGFSAADQNLRANRVDLTAAKDIGHVDGTAVKTQADQLSANAGGFVDIEQTGDVELLASSSGGDFDLTVYPNSPGDLTVTGDVHSGGDLNLTSTAGTITNNANITAVNNAILSANEHIRGTGLVTADHVDLTAENGDISENGLAKRFKVDSNTLAFDADDKVFIHDIGSTSITSGASGGGAQVSTAGSMDIDGDITAQTRTILTAQNGDLSVNGTSTVESVNGRLTLETDNGNINTAAGTTVQSKQDANMDAAGNIVNHGHFESTDGTATLEATGTITNSGSSVVGDSVSITAGTGVDNDGLIEATAGNVDITATTGDVDNSGDILATGNIDVTATAGTIINDGTVDADGDATLLANQHINGTGLVSGDQVSLTAENGSIEDVVSGNSRFDVNANDLSVDAGGRARIQEQDSVEVSHVDVGTNFNLKATNDITVTGDVDAGRNIRMSADNITTNVGTTSTAGRDVRLTADQDIHNNGILNAGRNAELTATNGSITNNGTVDADGDATLLANQNIRGTGLVAGDHVDLTAENGDISENGLAKKFEVDSNTLAFDADDKVFIHDIGSTSITSGTSGGGAQVSTAGSMDIDGDITAQTRTILTAHNGNLSVNGTSTVESVNGRLDLITNNGNINTATGTTVQSRLDATMDATGDINNHGHFESTTGTATVTATGTVTNSGTSIVGTTVNVTGGTGVDNDGLIQATAGDATVTATTGDVDNSGDILASNDVDINANTGSIINDGLVDAGNHADLHANQAIYTNVDVTGERVEGSSVTLTTDNGDIFKYKRQFSNPSNIITNEQFVVDAQDDLRIYGGGYSKVRDINDVTVQEVISNQLWLNADGQMDIVGNVTVGNYTDINAQNDLNVAGTSTVHSNNGNVFMKSQTGDINVDGTVESASASKNVSLDSLNGTVTVDGTVNAGNAAILYALNHINGTGLVTGNIVDLTAETGSIEDIVSGNARFDINANTLSVDAGERARIKEQDSVNVSHVDVGTNFNLRATDDITVTGNVDAGRHVRLNAKSITTNVGTTTTAGQDIELTARRTDINNNGDMFAGGHIIGIADRDINNPGHLEAVGDVVLDALGNITNGSPIRSVFSIYAGNDVLLYAGGDINNYSVIDAGRDVEAFADGDINNPGHIEAARDVYLDALGSITNGSPDFSTDSIFAGRDVLLFADVDINNYSSVTARKLITFWAGEDINNYGTVKARGASRAVGDETIIFTADTGNINLIGGDENRSGSVRATRGNIAFNAPNGIITQMGGNGRWSGSVWSNTTTQYDAVGLLMLGGAGNWSGSTSVGTDAILNLTGFTAMGSTGYYTPSQYAGPLFGPNGMLFDMTGATGFGFSDDSVIPVGLGMSFDFFGNPIADGRVSSNGLMYMGLGGSTSSQCCSPDGLPHSDYGVGSISFWHDDIDPPEAGTQHYLATGSEFILSFEDTKFFPFDGNLNVQLGLMGEGNSLGLAAGTVVMSFGTPLIPDNTPDAAIGLNAGNNTDFATLFPLGLGNADGIFNATQQGDLMGNTFLFTPTSGEFVGGFKNRAGTGNMSGAVVSRSGTGNITVNAASQDIGGRIDTNDVFGLSSINLDAKSQHYTNGYIVDQADGTTYVRTGTLNVKADTIIGNGTSNRLDIDAMNLYLNAGENAHLDEDNSIWIQRARVHTGDFDLTAGGDVTVQGRTKAGTDVNIDADGHITNNARIVAGDDVDLEADGDITNNHVIRALGGGVYGTSFGGSIINNHRIVAEQMVNLDTFGFGGRAVPVPVGRASLLGPHVSSGSGNILNYGLVRSRTNDVWMTARGGDIYNSDRIIAAENVFLDAFDIEFCERRPEPDSLVGGGIPGTRALPLAFLIPSGGGNITNDGRIIARNGNVSMTADGGNITNNNLIRGEENVTLMAIATDDCCGVDAGPSPVTALALPLVDDGPGGNVFNNGSIIATNQDVSITTYGGDIVNNDTITAGNDVNLDAFPTEGCDLRDPESPLALGTSIPGGNIINNVGANTQAGNNINANAQDGNIENTGTFIAGNDVSMNAGTDIINNELGVVDAGNNLLMLAGDDIENNGALNALNDADLTAFDDIFGTGLLTANDADLLSTNGNIGSRSSRFSNNVNLLSANARQGSAFVDNQGTVRMKQSVAGNTLLVRVLGAGDLINDGILRGENGVELFTDSGNIALLNDVLGRRYLEMNAGGSGNISGPGRINSDFASLRALGGDIDVNTTVILMSALAAGDISIDESASIYMLRSRAGGIFNINAVRTIFTVGLTEGVQGVNAIAGGNILDRNGGGLDFRSQGNGLLRAETGVVGLLTDPIEVDFGGILSVFAGGSIDGTSINIDGDASSFDILGNPPGLALINGQPFFNGDNPLLSTVPYLFTDAKVLLGPDNGTDDMLSSTELENVIAEIINNWVAPEGFDLRLIEQEGPDSEGFMLLQLQGALEDLQGTSPSAPNP